MSEPNDYHLPAWNASTYKELGDELANLHEAYARQVNVAIKPILWGLLYVRTSK